MKIYLHEQGVVLAGKGWEVVQKLKEYQKHFSTVSEWVSQTDTVDHKICHLKRSPLK